MNHVNPFGKWHVLASFTLNTPQWQLDAIKNAPPFHAHSSHTRICPCRRTSARFQEWLNAGTSPRPTPIRNIVLHQPNAICNGIQWLPYYAYRHCLPPALHTFIFSIRLWRRKYYLLWLFLFRLSPSIVSITIFKLHCIWQLRPNESTNTQRRKAAKIKKRLCESRSVCLWCWFRRLGFLALRLC